MNYFFNRFYRIMSLIVFGLSFSSLSWAAKVLPASSPLQQKAVPAEELTKLMQEVPVDLQTSIIGFMSPEDLASSALSEAAYQKIIRGFLNNIKELEALERESRAQEKAGNSVRSRQYAEWSKAWNRNKIYQDLVHFPQDQVLREIKTHFHDFEWRKKAVHMLLDAKTQFAEIPAGVFQMGSPETDQARFDNELQHWVKISSPYLLQRIQFSQLLLVLVTGENGSEFQELKHCPEDHLVLHLDEQDVSLCPRNPAEDISWNKISEKDEHQRVKAGTVIGILRDQFGIHTRLPTEAEWERAAHGMSDQYQSYSFGELAPDESNLQAHAWYNKNSEVNYQEKEFKGIHQVAMKLPNVFGLFDMHGNVWEWMEDLYGDYTAAPDKNSPLVDPVGRAGSRLVIRGGGSYFSARYLRSAFRNNSQRVQRWNLLGFRLVRTTGP